MDAEAFGNGEVSGGDNMLPPLVLRVRGHEVARDLLANELVVRLVTIERIDHVIAIAIGLRDGIVGAVAGGIRIAHDVEPVPAPTLAVVGGGKQAIDHFGEGVLRSVVDKRLNLFGRGRKARQIIGGATNQRPPARERGRLQSLGFEPGQDEVVDRRPHPAAMRDLLYGRLFHRLEGPE